MPRRRYINKNDPSTRTFQLLYRSQNDPLLNDEQEGDRALVAIGKSNNVSPQDHASSSISEQYKQGLHLADLEDELQDEDFSDMRDNEGEAAEQGVFFDDTQYDYMQHMRDLNQGSGAYFVDAIPTKVKGKGKQKQQSLEDALREVDIYDDEEDEAPSLVEDSLFSRTSKAKRDLERQQDIPDEIAGFQPDMDPRLREVLEALDDDEYVDEKDEEDVFGALGLDGRNNGELDLEDFALDGDLVDEEGWESDVTEKAVPLPNKPDAAFHVNDLAVTPMQSLPEAEELPQDAAAAAVAEDGDWLKDFAKYKRDTRLAPKAPPKDTDSIIAASAIQDKAPTLYTLNGTPLRQKKRKGALTNPSAYSMTSSSLHRGDGLQLLDARFDQVEKMYKLDEDDEFLDDMDGSASMVSGMTGASKMSSMSKMSTVSTKSFADAGAVRSDLDSMMDDFLGDYSSSHGPGGKRKGAKGKRGKNGNEVYGLQQLEEVRRELGPARIQRKTAKA